MIVWLHTGFCVVFDFWWVFSDFFWFSVASLQSLIIGIEKVRFTECIEVIWICLMTGYQIHCFGGGFVTMFALFRYWYITHNLITTMTESDDNPQMSVKNTEPLQVCHLSS